MSLASQAGPGEPDWPWHESAAADLAAAVPSPRATSPMYEAGHLAERQAWIAAVRALAPAAAGSLLLLLIRRAAAEGGWSHDTAARVRGLRGIRASLTAADAAYALRAAAALPDTWAAGEVLRCAAVLAGRAAVPGPGRRPPGAPGRGADDQGLAAAVAEAIESASRRGYLPAADRGQIIGDLSAVLPPPLPRSTAAAGTWPIAAADGWSAAVLAGLRAWTGSAGPASAAMRHLMSAAGRKPTRQWLAEADAIFGEPDAARLVRLLVETAVSADGALAPDRYGWGTASLAVSARNAGLLQAAAWAASAIDDDWVVPALTALAMRGAGQAGGHGAIEPGQVPAACITGLGLVASGPAIAALEQIARSAPGPAVRGQVRAALDVAARRLGREIGEFDERVVPDAGLDSGGQRVIASARLTARVRVSAGGEVVTEWRGRGGWSARRPPAADTAAGQPARLASREVAGALAAERSRLERLLAADRVWPAADWRRLYCEHPVTGPLASSLIWVFRPEGEDQVAGLPAAGGRLITLHGTRAMPASGTVALWHPVRAAAGEVPAWRDLLSAAGRAQPFPQACREAYPPTAAERAGATRSDRFAGRVLRYAEAFAMLTERGWAAAFLGPYDGGLSGQARMDIAGTGLAAVFDHAAVGVTPADLRVERCLAGPVTFRRRGRRSPVRLARVPDVTFSEVMRDIDMLVSATAVS